MSNNKEEKAMFKRLSNPDYIRSTYRKTVIVHKKKK